MLKNAPTLGAVDARLTKALIDSGYEENSRYSAPGGFVLVARMERIHCDGRSWEAAQRFAVDDRSGLSLSRGFSLNDYFRMLFRGERGRYRVLAFVVTGAPVVPGGRGLSATAASDLAVGGADALPDTIAQRPFTPSTNISALIYEFQRPASGAAIQSAPSRLLATRHLRQSGVLPALGSPNPTTSNGGDTCNDID